ncbi:MAG TPA: DivIVA domain-containing protein [Dermatophilaceae bacterium]|nr:DivIVA domain-containing protein [Dermatophilaceae bacterium]
MVWVLLALVAVAVVAVTLAAAAGRIHVDPMSDPVRSTPSTGLPPEPLAADLDAVRFDTALRGYRMDQVDEVLDVLRGSLADRERQLADVRAELAATRPVLSDEQPTEER